MKVCEECQKEAGTLYLSEGSWLCRHCAKPVAQPTCRLHEFGVENPIDAKGSTAHVRDIKNKRYDAKSDKFFYYKPRATYFFPGGK